MTEAEAVEKMREKILAKLVAKAKGTQRKQLASTVDRLFVTKESEGKLPPYRNASIWPLSPQDALELCDEYERIPNTYSLWGGDLMLKRRIWNRLQCYCGRITRPRPSLLARLKVWIRNLYSAKGKNDA